MHKKYLNKNFILGPKLIENRTLALDKTDIYSLFFSY